jgi:outer membrane lipoprotein-sorting protein
MKTSARNLLPILLLAGSLLWLRAEEPVAKSPAEIFGAALQRMAGIIEPGNGVASQTLSVRLELTKGDGLPKALDGQKLDVAFQAPDKLLLSAKVGDRAFSAGRNGQQLWVFAPDKHFGVIGEPGRPRFASAPDKRDFTQLGPFKFPLPKEQLALLPLLMNIERRPTEEVDGVGCHVLQVTPKPEAAQALKLPAGQFKLWLRTNDDLPARVGYSDGKAAAIEVHFRDLKLGEPWPAEQWQLPARAGDKIERTALSHLTRFTAVALSMLNQKIPALGPATGERRVVATEGNGRLEKIDGTRVLFLSGTPEEMGRQHGILLKKEIRDVAHRILYGVGVGSSFEKGKWFFGVIEEAQRRLSPFIAPRYLEEMDALALGSGLKKEEVRLANFFPELFHCSGFALFGEATVGGQMYHGRILDYLKGMGLEQNAVVIVMKPDRGNAWVNVSYAGFIGSVTAMNEKHVAIGEMGGRGEGHWDGKPMAQLVREVMERANTIEEAVEIMRRGPRTCEYYYVISDAKSKTAVGIAATPTTFEVVRPGEAHPRLPDAIKDTVLMSAGDRYKKLVERVKAGYGQFDAASARELMRRPVAMNSNIHSVLFAPDTLDFWVANADAKNVASHTRYTHYTLAELLTGLPLAPASATAGQAAAPGP